MTETTDRNPSAILLPLPGAASGRGAGSGNGGTGGSGPPVTRGGALGMTARHTQNERARTMLQRAIYERHQAHGDDAFQGDGIPVDACMLIDLLTARETNGLARLEAAIREASGDNDELFTTEQILVLIAVARNT